MIIYTTQMFISGLSTDTKPLTPSKFCIFYETDTDTRYIFTGTAWEKESPIRLTVVVTASDLDNLLVTPKVLIPAVSGKKINLLDCYIVTDSGSQYAAGVDILVGTLNYAITAPMRHITTDRLASSSNITLLSPTDIPSRMEINKNIILATENDLTLGLMGFIMTLVYEEI